VFKKETQAPPIGAGGNITAKTALIGHPVDVHSLLGGEQSDNGPERVGMRG
jgi:hypothetical protein